MRFRACLDAHSRSCEAPKTLKMVQNAIILRSSGGPNRFQGLAASLGSRFQGLGCSVWGLQGLECAEFPQLDREDGLCGDLIRV